MFQSCVICPARAQRVLRCAVPLLPLTRFAARLPAAAWRLQASGFVNRALLCTDSLVKQSLSSHESATALDAPAKRRQWQEAAPQAVARGGRHSSGVVACPAHCQPLTPAAMSDAANTHLRLGEAAFVCRT
jgi:hypothetical protein